MILKIDYLGLGVRVLIYSGFMIVRFKVDCVGKWRDLSG